MSLAQKLLTDLENIEMQFAQDIQGFLFRHGNIIDIAHKKPDDSAGTVPAGEPIIWTFRALEIPVIGSRTFYQCYKKRTLKTAKKPSA